MNKQDLQLGLATKLILSSMFNDGRNNHAGYRTITTELVDSGTCKSTIHARDIQYGTASDYITITDSEEGIDLIDITFDREKAIASDAFRLLLDSKCISLSEEVQLLNKKSEALVNLITELKRI